MLSRQGFQRGERKESLGRIAEQAGGEVEQDFVDQSGSQQGSVQAATSFDMHLVQAAPGQFVQQRMQIDPALAIRQIENFRTAFAQSGGFFGDLRHRLSGTDQQDIACLQQAGSG